MCCSAASRSFSLKACKAASYSRSQGSMWPLRRGRIEEQPARASERSGGADVEGGQEPCVILTR